MWVEGIPHPSAVPVQVRVLLHLQRHDLLLLSVSQVIGGAPLGAAAPVDVMPPLVLFIVKGSKGQDVEEKQRSSNRNSHRKFCGVVPLVHQVRLVVAALCLGGKRSWVWALGYQNFGLWCPVSGFRRRNLYKDRRPDKDFILALTPLRL